MVTIITLDNLADYNANQVYNLEADFPTPYGYSSRLVDTLGTVDKMMTFIEKNPNAINVRLRLNRNAYKVSPARWD